jgi:hypothetical protein
MLTYAIAPNIFQKHTKGACYERAIDTRTDKRRAFSNLWWGVRLTNQILGFGTFTTIGGASGGEILVAWKGLITMVMEIAGMGSHIRTELL